MAARTPDAPQRPTPEALALSASLFTSSIAAWIPANFGVPKSEVDKSKEFDRALKEERGGRLGLGHPSIDDPKRLAAFSAGGGGLASLSKKLGKEKKEIEGAEQQKGKGGDDDEEEESRVRSVGKTKKNTAQDLFGGKKKKKPEAPQVHPLARAQALSVVEAPAEATTPEFNSPPTTPESPVFPGHVELSPPSTPPNHMPTSSPGGSGIFPFQGPFALESPQAKRLMNERKERKKRELEEDDEESGTEGQKDSKEEGASPRKSKSKTQLRRESRKKAKVAKGL
ncbi:hypothetical protein B9479_002636 [Cryptococcus floricola]|uniref:Uncharacterized protein n=1 Tax=Cryptococcus floricola TaxID=2591691 RepID=A0A5D3AZC7_9TREE|nr:hypothetical protein B9479_002636 [Cryptococcus floricola]